MSWTLSYYTRQGFHVVSAENMLFMTFNIQIRSEAGKLDGEAVPFLAAELAMRVSQCHDGL
jgi:hypothetical protein